MVSNAIEEEGLLLVHRNARLAPAGRMILVQWVLQGRPISHVAKELGVSRQCAHRWISRFRSHGAAGLVDRSSRPRRFPTATPSTVVSELLAVRQAERIGRDELALRFTVSASTASRIIARAGLPRLHELDPVTGIRIRAAQTTQLRYKHENPGDLIHVDVKKLGHIPDGGGWRIDGPTVIDHDRCRDRARKLGFDFVHVAVDDHSRLAFAQILPDEKGTTCATFLSAAATFFAQHGVAIRGVITDNAKNYVVSHAFQDTLRRLGARHVTTRPHCPCQNGKAERFNRTLQENWAYWHPFLTNQAPHDALAPWLEHYNYARAHTACGGLPPISRVSPTS